MFFERPSLPVTSFARGDGDASSLSEVFSTSFSDAAFQAGMAAQQGAVEGAIDAHIDRVREATGNALENPYRTKMLDPRVPLHISIDSFDAQLDALAAQYPDKRDIIKPPQGYLEPVYAEMRRREQAAASAIDRNAATWRPNIPLLGETPLNPAALAGSFAGQMLDPEQALVNVFIGPEGKVASGVKSVLWNGVKMGAANAAVEALQQPAIQEWRAKAGMEHGADMALKSVALAGLGGFVLDAGVRGASRALGLTKGMDALDAAARVEPETSPLRQAADGNPDALHALARDAGALQDPAVRGAIETDAANRSIETRVDGVDSGDGLRNLAQALRAAEDDSEPPPGRADQTPPARDEPLADNAAAARGQTFLKDGKPVSFQAFNPQRLAVDADTFQFRRQVNRAGTTGRLSGVGKWDPMASGKVVVFERANGEQVIADGHHRLELAKRLADQQPELQGYLFREADGWTPAEVRAYAAKKNMIDSPRVDPVDAARVLRERPDLLDGSVPVGDETIRQARALAKLSDEGFGMVVGGVLPPNYAALVGDLVPDKSRHASMMAEIAEAAPSNVREARYLVGDLLQLPVREEVQFTLFGAGRIERSILKERSKVLDQALKALREDKRVFEMLTREAGRIEEAGNQLAEDVNAARAQDAEVVSAMIEQLAMNRGPVSSWLSEAALTVSQGVPASQAAKAFAHRVSEALAKDGVKALIAEQSTLRANGFDEPGGPEARLQVEQLEGEFAEDIERALNPDLFQERQGETAQSSGEAKTEIEQAVDDFVGSVSDLKSRLGLQTRQRDFNSTTKTLFSLNQELSTVSLENAVAEIKRGSRVAFVMQHVQAFMKDVDDVAAAADRSSRVQLSQLNPETLQKFIVAAEDLQQIITNRIEAGYQLSDEATAAGKVIETALERAFEHLDKIISEADTKIDDLAAYLDDIDERRQILLDEKFGDDEAAREAYEEALGSNSGDKSIYELSPLPGKGDTLLDLAADDAALAQKIIARYDEAAQAIVRTSPEKMTLEEVESVHETVSHLLDQHDAVSRFLEQTAAPLRDAFMKFDPASFSDDHILPAVERLEKISEDLSSVADSADEILARQESKADHPSRGALFSIGHNDSIDLTFDTSPDAFDKGGRVMDSLEIGGSQLRYGLGKDGKTIYIKSLETPPDEAGKGQARALMTAIVRAADEQGKTLQLDAQPWDGARTNVAQLRKFYRSLGFKDVSGDGLMQRKPRGKWLNLFALRSATYTHTPAAAKLMPEIRAELMKTIDMLPKDVRLRVLDNIVFPGGSRAEGLWDGADRIIYVALSAGDPVRTSRHEVVHALRQSGLLSDGEFDTLYGFAEKMGLREGYAIDKLYKGPYGKAYGHLGKYYVESLLREETIANMFADYSLNGRRFGDVAGGGMIDKIIDEVVRFLAKLRNSLDGFGFRDVRDVFEAIESGAMARREFETNWRDAKRTDGMSKLVEGCRLT